jgi:tRNA(Ile)-lysidine synthetase-like protein
MADSDLPSRIRAHLLQNLPELVGTHLVVAVSGGADSVALTHLLAASGLAERLTLVHVHHGVRGAAADADAAFVVRLGERLGLMTDIRRVDGRNPGAEGREASWRHLRYAALEEARRHHGARWIATAHHRDDVAEGVLMQLVRGGGLRAMAGIRRRHGRVLRPLLPFARHDLVSFLEHAGLPWCEDATNADPVHPRNRVRRDLLPSLEAAEPAVRRHLIHLAEDLARDDEALTRRAHALPNLRPWHPDGGVPLGVLASADAAIRSRWLQFQSLRAGLGTATRSQIRGLDLVVAGRGHSVTLNRRWRLRRFAGALWLEPETSPAPWRRPVPPAGLIALGLPGWRLVVRFDPTGSRRASPWRAALAPRADLQLCSVDSLSDPAQRQWVTRRLARRVPRHLRPPWPVLMAGAKILWIPGVLVSDEPRRWTAVAEVEIA